MFTAKQVAKELGRHFGKKFTYTEADDQVDGEITIDERLSVQVGDDYLILAEELEEYKIRMFPERKRISDIVVDIKRIQM